MAKTIQTMTAVSLTEIKNRCPKNQLDQLAIFLAKRRKYQEQLLLLPKGLPKIDWEYYKRHVRSEYVPLVLEYQKKYESFSVPYPEDTYSKQIDDIKDIIQSEIEEFKKQSNEKIAEYEKKIEFIKNTIPYNQMTWEDYCCIYPGEAPDFINSPTFWPHTKEEQLGYVDPFAEKREKEEDEGTQDKPSETKKDKDKSSSNVTKEASKAKGKDVEASKDKAKDSKDSKETSKTPKDTSKK